MDFLTYKRSIFEIPQLQKNSVDLNLAKAQEANPLPNKQPFLTEHEPETQQFLDDLHKQFPKV